MKFVRIEDRVPRDAIWGNFSFYYRIGRVRTELVANAPQAFHVREAVNQKLEELARIEEAKL
jgi:hypothetical protein